MGLKFKRQKPLGRYIADFVCEERKLIIELDGGQHAEQATYDTKRDDWLRSQGYVVLRFWNNEVMGELEGVLEKIRLTLSPDPSPASRRGEQDAPLAPDPSPASRRGEQDTPLAPDPSHASRRGEQDDPLAPLAGRGMGRGE